LGFFGASALFRELAVKASRVATGSLTRHEVRTVFRRREADGVLPSGEAASLYDELTADIAVNYLAELFARYLA
jgi:hypothetical protein